MKTPCSSFTLRRLVPMACGIVVLASANAQDTRPGNTREMILTDGQAAVITGDAVKLMPMNQTPPQLRAALNDAWSH